MEEKKTLLLGLFLCFLAVGLPIGIESIYVKKIEIRNGQTFIFHKNGSVSTNLRSSFSKITDDNGDGEADTFSFLICGRMLGCVGTVRPCSKEEQSEFKKYFELTR